MARIQFNGPEDIRVLDAADLKKAGVEEGFKKTEFYKGVPQEVSNEVASAILSTAGLFGRFSESVTEEPAPAAEEQKPARNGK